MFIFWFVIQFTFTNKVSLTPLQNNSYLKKDPRIYKTIAEYVLQMLSSNNNTKLKEKKIKNQHAQNTLKIDKLFKKNSKFKKKKNPIFKVLLNEVLFF